ncbi:alpha/beta hydrolase [Cellulomonas sp. RIT-PI-Y]|uniref:alpha/beta hydrolase n=1 Tax=Cellulomonas sp. RIT-PI-Y TaxID=3035297 RepID=UPI0021DB0974|nr:alpha/beta hydrolase [Cellulomonas sp. RIT-PI-Y]
MSRWSPDDPGAGDADGMEDLVLRLASHLDVLSTTGREIGVLVARTREGWTGQGAQAWETSVSARAAECSTVEQEARRGAEVVNTYVNTVLSIRSRAMYAAEDLESARGTLRRAEDAWRTLQSDPDRDDFDLRMALGAVQCAEQEVLDCRAALDRLVVERQTLDDEAASALQTGTPPDWAAAGGAARRLPTDLFARSTASIANQVRALPDGAEGDAAARWIVGRLTAEQFDALLAACPELAVRLMRADTGGAFAARFPELAAAMRVRDLDERTAAIVAATSAMSREDLVLVSRMYPGVVGNLDGMPLTARIDANRIAVTAALVKGERRLDEVRARLAELVGQTSPDAMREFAALIEERNALVVANAWYGELLTEAVDTIDAGGSAVTVTGHQVVLFDPATGQFGELVGYAGAPNLAVLVGGTGTNTGTMADQRARAWTFVDVNRRDLAVITYLGGPMPQSVSIENPTARHAFEAVDPTYATAIGPRLASFANGVRAVTGATITVAGHSYGGSVVGAAEARGMVVDRIVHIESAGAGPGVTSIQDYAAPDTPRYSMTAPGDFIGTFQGVSVGTVLGHGADPDELSGVIRLETGRTDRADPTSPILEGFGSHSQVFFPETDAWENIEQVMTGGQVSVWTDRRDAVALGLMDPQYEHPMQDPDFTPATREVP